MRQEAFSTGLTRTCFKGNPLYYLPWETTPATSNAGCLRQVFCCFNQVDIDKSGLLVAGHLSILIMCPSLFTKRASSISSLNFEFEFSWWLGFRTSDWPQQVFILNSAVWRRLHLVFTVQVAVRDYSYDPHAHCLIYKRDFIIRHHCSSAW